MKTLFFWVLTAILLALALQIAPEGKTYWEQWSYLAKPYRVFTGKISLMQATLDFSQIPGINNCDEVKLLAFTVNQGFSQSNTFYNVVFQNVDEPIFFHYSRGMAFSQASVSYNSESFIVPLTKNLQTKLKITGIVSVQLATITIWVMAMKQKNTTTAAYWNNWVYFPAQRLTPYSPTTLAPITKGIYNFDFTRKSGIGLANLIKIWHYTSCNYPTPLYFTLKFQNLDSPQFVEYCQGESLNSNAYSYSSHNFIAPLSSSLKMNLTVSDSLSNPSELSVYLTAFKIVQNDNEQTKDDHPIFKNYWDNWLYLTPLTIYSSKINMGVYELNLTKILKKDKFDEIKINFYQISINSTVESSWFIHFINKGLPSFEHSSFGASNLNSSIYNSDNFIAPLSDTQILKLMITDTIPGNNVLIVKLIGVRSSEDLSQDTKQEIRNQFRQLNQPLQLKKRDFTPEEKLRYRNFGEDKIVENNAGKNLQKHHEQQDISEI